MMATMAPSSERDRPGVDPWLVELYRSEYRSLVRLATLLVDDRGAAEELVQDSFVAAARARARSELRDVDAAPAYLRSAVLNRSRSLLRKRVVRHRHLRSVEAPPTEPGADAPALAGEETRRVLAALDRLPARQRAVLVLRYYGDLSEAEIADALGIARGSVKTHAHRGLRALEAHLEGT